MSSAAPAPQGAPPDEPASAPLEMEPAACALCGQSGGTHVLSARDARYGVPGVFHVVRCVRCGLVRLDPRPTQDMVPRLYPAAYGPHSGAAPAAAGSRWARLSERVRRAVASEWAYRAPGRTARWTVARTATAPAYALARVLGTLLLPVAPAGGRALDVGCGSGTLLRHLAALGWEPYGVEPVAPAAALAAAIPGATVVQGTLEEARYPNASFDLVLLWHVLEHVPSPHETLTEIARVLKPGGRLLVMVPNVESWEFGLFRAHWLALDPPRHFWHYAPHTLTQQARRAGLRVARVQHLVEPATLSASLAAAGVGDPRRARPPLLARGLFLLLWLVSWLETRVGRGGTILAVCERPEA